MANITRWDPFGEMVHLRQAMDRLFDESFTRPWRLLGWEGETFVPLDVYETDDELVVKASLPGVKPEDVDVSIIGDTLSIKGEFKSEEETKKPSYHRQERRYGSFHRAAHSAHPGGAGQGGGDLRARRPYPDHAQGRGRQAQDHQGQGPRHDRGREEGRMAMRPS